MTAGGGAAAMTTGAGCMSDGGGGAIPNRPQSAGATEPVFQRERSACIAQSYVLLPADANGVRHPIRQACGSVKCSGGVGCKAAGSFGVTFVIDCSTRCRLTSKAASRVAWPGHRNRSYIHAGLGTAERQGVGLTCRSQSWWRTAASVKSGTPSVRRSRSTLGSRLARFPKLAIRSRLARAHTQNLNDVTDGAQHFVKAAPSSCVTEQSPISRINRVW